MAVFPPSVAIRHSPSSAGGQRPRPWRRRRGCRTSSARRRRSARASRHRRRRHLVALGAAPMIGTPGRSSCGGPPAAAGDGADRLGLVRLEDGELDALAREGRQGRLVDRALGQPHPLGVPSEAAAEVGQAPEDLGPSVARIGEGEDRMMEGLGDGVAVAVQARAAVLVGLEEPSVGVGVGLLVPGQQSRAKIEGKPVVVGDEVHDASGTVDNAGLGVGDVALAGRAVPVWSPRRRAGAPPPRSTGSPGGADRSGHGRPHSASSQSY